MSECWRWDERFVYHVIDHGLDGGRGGSYRFTDGRWVRRGWSLDLAANRVSRFDRDCRPIGESGFPYRVRAWLEPSQDAGSDLGT